MSLKKKKKIKIEIYQDKYLLMYEVTAILSLCL